MKGRIVAVCLLFILYFKTGWIDVFIVVISSHIASAALFFISFAG